MLPRTKQPISTDVFLLSINVRFDAEHPERIRHFRPTAKSIALLEALLGHEKDRAFFVVAPYGTGKSLTATYLLHLVENQSDSRDVLKEIGARFKDVSPEFGEMATRRARSKTKSGLVIVLNGFQENLAAAVKSSVLESLSRVGLGRQATAIRNLPSETMEDAITLLAELRAFCSKHKLDRTVLIWDEFGRYLESLIAEGRTSALNDVQLLAEFCSRTKKVPFTLGLLLHQELLQYAGSLPQTVRTEWAKIEGRFSTLQYVDDSKEIYKLAGEVVVARTDSDQAPLKKDLVRVARRAKKAGLFRDFTESELVDLFNQVYPMSPATLFLLPRLAARVAQNERTLFSFLVHSDLASDVTCSDLYDYFSPSMRADVGVGGTYRQWLETESALAKTESDAEARVLKTACLLGLGLAGERARAQVKQLLLSVSGYEDEKEWARTVKELIGRKLLLHRRHSDEVTVWHGTDADLRGRLEEEKRRTRDHFDLLKFLSKEAPAPVWRPLQYNAEYGIRRFLQSEYHSAKTAEGYLQEDLTLAVMPAGCDGKVIYIIPQSPEELSMLKMSVPSQLSHERVLVVLPGEQIPLLDAALEVHCLLRMQLDDELTGQDPLILPELQQMTDDSREHLQILVDRLVQPSPNGPEWYYRGTPLEVDSPSLLRQKLSDIMGEVFHLTPQINNELIVRNKVTPNVVNSRKKLLLGILERYGAANLAQEGNFPDASMFRTVLVNTRLYREDKSGQWAFVDPERVRDRGLRAVWREIKEFVSEPDDQPKYPTDLLDRLLEPPYGLRPGVIPILVASALRAFPAPTSLRRGENYVTDVLPSDIEALCREPDDYRLIVPKLGSREAKYLERMAAVFASGGQQVESDNDLIRRVFDAFELWKRSLPLAAFSSRQVSDNARRLQAFLQMPHDPADLFLREIPAAFGTQNCARVVDAVERAARELQEVNKQHFTNAKTILQHAFSAKNGGDLLETASHWAECFPSSFTSQLGDGVIKGLVSRAKMPYRSESELVDSLSSLLVGKPIRRWDDSTVLTFEREVQSAVRQLEDSALSTKADLTDEAIDGVSRLLKGRIEQLYHRFVEVAGEKEAKSALSTLLTNSKPEGRRGNSTRRNSKSRGRRKETHR